MSKYWRHKFIGTRAEERVQKLLSEYGKCERVFTNKLSPDLRWEIGGELGFPVVTGIEVKSVKGISGGKIGRIRIDKSTWNNLTEWCIEEQAIPLLVIEIRGGHKASYFSIKGDKITDLISKRKGKALSLTIWQVLNLGDKVE